jgi:hypothetical protein
MVSVRKVSDQFAARVIAARLGAAGIVAQLRGGGIEGPYPMGPIEVLVSEDDFDDARELLLADDVESAFDEGGGDDDRVRAPDPRLRYVAIAVLACLLLGTIVRLLTYVA